ncbi:MAG: MvaI/BcnI family restriction endonuclease [Clostridiales bacterium]|nr:MvaI/BcnI family restriction endonuclease [Clostridiales bacterium]
MIWTIETIKERLISIKAKGYIPVPERKYRKDDGIVGQILESEFGITENNLHIKDLGAFELKGLRHKKGRSCMLTLFHQKSSCGLTPIQIFDRFGYIKKSNRSDIMKKKLFTTIRGNKVNSLGFILRVEAENEINLYFHEEYLATWDLSEARNKIDQIVLAFANTKGTVNSKEEQFHYTKACLLSDMLSLADAIAAGAVVMDLCIDQPADGSRGAHDRGPHIRIPVKKLDKLYAKIEELL